jgi:hypothetical protein
MMDTPSGTLPPSEFSPLGAPYGVGDFGLEETGPLPYTSGNTNTFLDFKEDSPIAHRRKSPERSPLTDFMSSPFEMNLHTMARSPLLLQQPPDKSNAVTFSSATRRLGHLESSAKPAPRKLWPKDDAPPSNSNSGTASAGNAGALRMEVRV